MINCIAIDDEPLALEIITAYCEKIPYIELLKTFTQVSKAQKHLRKYPVDLLFLDIQMPDINGINFYNALEQKPLVIFTTAHTKYAVEGFEVSAVDYLTKPFNLIRFETACEKAKNYLQSTNPQQSNNRAALYIRSEYALVKILFEEIIYIETFGDFIRIHQKNKKPVLTLMSLRKMEEKLPNNLFIRVHRSFIVSLTKIKSIRRSTITIEDQKIPIGSTYKGLIDKYF